MRRHKATVALVAWTFLVWTTRIGNIWRDGDLDAAAKWGRTALALSFTALALGVVVALRRRARTPLVAAVGALGAWTTGVWIVRVAGIVAADHAVGFTVVHAVLAVVSIVLAVAAWRETRRLAASPGGGRRDDSVDPRRDQLAG
jgi:hypothetical protein